MEGIAGRLRGLAGRPLAGVVYRCLTDESSASEVATEPRFHLGGEVELRFEGAAPVFLSWEPIRREEAWFRLGARAESFFLTDSLSPFDAATTPPWRGLRGEPLRSCSVLGADGIPFAVELRFPLRTVLIATGTENQAIGDGDDVLVLTRENLPQLRRSEALERLWEENGPQH